MGSDPVMRKLLSGAVQGDVPLGGSFWLDQDGALLELIKRKRKCVQAEVSCLADRVNTKATVYALGYATDRAATGRLIVPRCFRG